MSDTPLTDAVAPHLNLSRSEMSDCAQQLRNLAKALERALAAKTTECERLREDAERYRWLRGDTTDYSVLCEQGLCGEVMDSAIDAARKETL